MNSSESAEAVVKMSLEGTEIAVKIAGEAALKIATFFVALSQEKQMTKGKTKINNMLKSGKPLSIFTLKKEDLKKFKDEAERYGVLYTVISNKKNKDIDSVDILAREDDAKRIDQIYKRFKLSTVDINTIKSEIEKDKIEKMVKEAKDQGFEPKSKEEKLVDDILIKPIKKEENEAPLQSKVEKSHQLERLSKSKEMETSKMKKPSVRKTLKDIKKEQEQKLSKEEKNLLKNKEPKLNNTAKIKKKSRKKKEKGR